MSYKPEDTVFANLDQVALYTVKMVKRIVRVGFGGRLPKEGLVKQLIDVLDFNLNELQIDRQGYFHTIRDYSRVFHNEWDTMSENGSRNGRTRYNSVLIVIALKLGLEKLWIPDGGTPLAELTVSELAAQHYPDGTPTFALKYLDQLDTLFDYFAKHSPNIENVRLPLSDNDNFLKCTKLTNLCVIELGGGVADKVLCNALWNVGSKKSDKVLEMVIKDTKTPKPWTLTLPHLEVLRNNILKTETQMSVMRVALGAAALAIQPKMDTVESLLSWGTAEAILHLLDMEAKYKSMPSSRWKLNVTTLSFKYEKKMDSPNLDKIIKLCPKLKILNLFDTKDFHPDLSLFVRIVPVLQIKQLSLDAWELTTVELYVLLAEMKNLEHLTLRLTPMCIWKFNIPNCGELRETMSEEEYMKLSLISPIKTLVLEFIPQPRETIESILGSIPSENETESIIHFLSILPYLREIYFRNTVALSASFVVFGCIGGSLAVLSNLNHLSIISCPEDVPYCLSLNHPLLAHFEHVQNVLIDIQEDVTFKHLEKLKSLEIDEVYISSAFDGIIKALRLSGVCVSVMYRKRI